MSNSFRILLAISLIFATWLLKLTFKLSAQFCEDVYGQFLYPFFQKIENFVESFFNVIIFGNPIAYLVVFHFLFFIVSQLYKLGKSTISFPKFGTNILLLTSFIYCSFYLLWGYNYYRPSFVSHAELELVEPTKDYILEDFERTVASLNTIRKTIIPIHDTIAWYDESLYDYDYKIVESTKEFLSQSGYKTNFNNRYFFIHPKGVLMRFGTSGMLFPFTGEALIDSGMPMIRRPHTMAHELAHTFGVTGEGECNFIAMQACLNSNNSLAQYSGLLHYYSYAARQAYQQDSLAFQEINHQLDSLIIRDIQSLRKCSDQFPDLVPKLRDSVYDSYLKAQGIDDGINNYSKVYLINYAWTKQKINFESELNQ